jgi:hypothetical protein
MNEPAFIERHQELEQETMAMQEAAQQLNTVRCVSPFLLDNQFSHFQFTDSPPPATTSTMGRKRLHRTDSLKGW